MSLSPFLAPTPSAWDGDSEIVSWLFNLNVILDDLSREGGIVSTGEETTATVVTHAEKLDFVTVTQAVNLDTVESDTASNKSALAGLQDSLPEYSISNDGTDRVFNANAAAGAITSPPTQAEVEGVRDAILELADVVSTLIRDLAQKDLLGT